MTDASRDQNHIPVALGVSSTDSAVTLPFKIDSSTGRLLADSATGGGTVTSVSVVTANGISGSVATATTTPAITLTLGAITPTTVNGNTFTTGSSTYTGTAGQTYTFPSTSASIARTDAANTFTGIQTFSTPIATGSVATMTATVGGGVPTPPNNTTTFLRGDGTFATPAGSGDVSKVGTPVNNQVVVWTGDGTVEGDAALTYDSTTDTLTSVNFAGDLTGNVTGNVSGSSGSTTGNAATVTTNANLTGVVTSVGNATAIADAALSIAKTSGLQTALDAKQATITFGTGVQTALGVNIGSAGAPVLFDGALGTPSSGTVTNLTGTASININGTVGATTPTTGVFTTLVAGSTTSLLLGTAGSAVGNIGFRNATSGTITLAPTTGALGTITTTLPAFTGTVCVAATSTTTTQALFASSTAGQPAYRAIAAGDLPATLTSGTAITNAALTTPAAFTTGGTITLAENTSIALDPAGSADGKYSGITVTATAGYTQAFGDLVYLAVADSRWELADADALATSGNVALAMVVVAGTDGAACTLLLQGIIRADAKFPAMTVGATQYVGETAGAIQGTIPTGADNIIRTVGYALTADELYFNPSTDWQVTVA